jgi:hypothetical protein
VPAVDGEVVYRGAREQVAWAFDALATAGIEASVLEDPAAYALPQSDRSPAVWHLAVAPEEARRAREILAREQAGQSERVKLLSRHLERAALWATVAIGAFVGIEIAFRGRLGVRAEWLGIGWLVAFALFARRRPTDSRLARMRSPPLA